MGWAWYVHFERSSFCKGGSKLREEARGRQEVRRRRRMSSEDGDEDQSSRLQKRHSMYHEFAS